jgi:hypothetical protein
MFPPGFSWFLTISLCVGYRGPEGEHQRDDGRRGQTQRLH